MHTTQGLLVESVSVPGSLDETGAGAFLALVELENLVCRQATGLDDLADSAATLLPKWRAQQDSERIGLIAREAGEIVGAARLVVPRDGARTAQIGIFVAPEHRGRGAEEALLDAIESEASRRGRDILHSESYHHPGAAGPRLDSPAGLGAVPADDEITRFHLGHDFTLGQVERISTFDLTGSFDHVERLLNSARRHAGSGYRVTAWEPPTPSQYADGYAAAIGRMSLDVPAGDLLIEPERWDAARLARMEENMRAGGQKVLVTAAIHESTGTIAAFNELVLDGENGEPTWQYNTLVLPEHRGRRLGMLVKCAGLISWRERRPTSPHVITFNAEENRHMLDVNEAIGFVPVATMGAWHKEMGGAR